MIAALAGELDFRFFKRATIKTLILERVDTTLFALSYDYVGEMSETVAHLWPDNPDPDFVLPDFDEIITFLHNAKRSEIETQLTYWLDNLSPTLRWTLIKLGTGGLRVGLSARRLKTILAEYGQVDVSDIENVWHGLSAPYTELLAWLEGRAHKPDISEKVVFHPVMLAHPLSAEERALLPYQHYCAEYKYDGIRVQIVVKNGEKALFSRTGDDISHSFPDVLSWFTTPGVYDGELLAFVDGEIGAFNLLQQRLNKKFIMMDKEIIQLRSELLERSRNYLLNKKGGTNNTTPEGVENAVDYVFNDVISKVSKRNIEALGKVNN